MRLLKKWGADDFNRALYHAAKAGQLEAMRLLKEWGADDFNWAIMGTGESSEATRSLLLEWL
jgi:hypothetical protein